MTLSLEEGGSNSNSNSEGNQSYEQAPPQSHGTLTLLPLIALIFYETSGGPYGIEGVMEGGGPTLAILGFLIFPFIWSLPQALVTCELGTAYPVNGGFVVWVTEAFGPFWGFQEGWLRWLALIVACSLYPPLFLDYASELFSFLESGTPRRIAILLFVLILSAINYIGVVIVGIAAILLVFMSMSPFVALTILAIPKIKPHRWFKVDFDSVNWRLYLNTLSWLLSSWDGVSVFVSEIKNPRKTLVQGLFSSLVLVALGYIVPLAAGIGAVESVPSDWENGFLAHVAKVISGQFLNVWIIVGATFCNAGLFEAQLTSASFNLLGMSEMGMLPKVFGYRSRFQTPSLGILVSSLAIYALANLAFDQLINTLNMVYSLALLLQMAAFIRLRFSKPNIERPFKIPVGKIGVILICLIPSVFFVIIICIAPWKTILTGVACMLVGFGLYPVLEYVKTRWNPEWLQFEQAKEYRELFANSHGLEPQSAGNEG